MNCRECEFWKEDSCTREHTKTDSMVCLMWMMVWMLAAICESVDEDKEPPMLPGDEWKAGT